MTKNEIIGKLEKYKLSQWKKIGRCLCDRTKQFPDSFPENYYPALIGYNSKERKPSLEQEFIYFCSKIPIIDRRYKRSVHRGFVMILAYEYRDNPIVSLMLETKCWENIELFRTYFKVLVDHVSIE